MRAFLFAHRMIQLVGTNETQQFNTKDMKLYMGTLEAIQPINTDNASNTLARLHKENYGKGNKMFNFRNLKNQRFAIGVTGRNKKNLKEPKNPDVITVRFTDFNVAERNRLNHLIFKFNTTIIKAVIEKSSLQEMFMAKSDENIGLFTNSGSRVTLDEFKKLCKVSFPEFVNMMIKVEDLYCSLPEIDAEPVLQEFLNRIGKNTFRKITLASPFFD